MLLAGHLREDFALNGAGARRNAADHVRVEEVEPSIDLVGYKRLGLFHKLLDLAVGLRNHNSILAGVLNFRYYNGALLPVVFVELNELLQGVFTNNI